MKFLLTAALLFGCLFTYAQNAIDGKKFSYTLSFNGNTINCIGELVSDDEIKTKNEMGEGTLTRVKE